MGKVVLRGVVKRFGDISVIHGADLDIGHGEFAVFVGPSGCGKTTLLRLIAGLEEVTDGEIFIAGKEVTDLAPDRRGAAMVFQSYALYPHMTVRQNMGFSLKLARRPRTEIDRHVEKAAGILQIENLLDRRPRQLSGGQRQRVAIGRAIVRQPEVFLFDEPLSNLDAALRVKMRVELAELHREIGATMIYVTHDQVEAMTMADRIVVLNAGRIEQAGSPPELYDRPANRFVAGFIGSPTMNFIDTHVRDAGDGVVRVGLPGGGELALALAGPGPGPGAPVCVGIRPEHLRPGAESGGAVLQGRVVHLEYLGGVQYAHLAVPPGPKAPAITLVVTLPGRYPAVAGETLSVTLPAEECHLFDGEGAAFALGVTRPEPPRSRSAAAPRIVPTAS